MLQRKKVCPFLKKACIDCAVYRGRHTSIGTAELSDRDRHGRLSDDESARIAALKAFFDYAVASRI